MRRLVVFIIVALSLYQLWCWFAPISHSPGVTSRGEPQQTDFVSEQRNISLKGWTLEPLAMFNIEARVLSKHYYSDDSTSSISPVDLALGWGPMSDSAVLDKLDISQGNRFFHWRYWGQAPIPEKEITRHATNVHIIPANDAVNSKLNDLKKGSLIKVVGYLVEARHPSLSRPWRSSLKREDSGDGACEIIYVKSVREL